MTHFILGHRIGTSDYTLLCSDQVTENSYLYTNKYKILVGATDLDAVWGFLSTMARCEYTLCLLLDKKLKPETMKEIIIQIGDDIGTVILEVL